MVTTSLAVIVVISDGFLHCEYKQQKIVLSSEPTKYGSKEQLLFTVKKKIEYTINLIMLW